MTRSPAPGAHLFSDGTDTSARDGGARALRWSRLHRAGISAGRGAGVWPAASGALGEGIGRELTPARPHTWTTDSLTPFSLPRSLTHSFREAVLG